MGQKLTWEVRDDVHTMGVSARETRDDMKARNRVTKCEFTVRPATLGCPTVVSRQENACRRRPAGSPKKQTLENVAHVPPPAGPACYCHRLLCRRRVQR